MFVAFNVDAATISEGVLGIVDTYEAADDIKHVMRHTMSVDIIELPESAEKKIREALRNEAELRETVRTGLPRKARGA